jgi:hypothetical protein
LGVNSGLPIGLSPYLKINKNKIPDLLPLPILGKKP